MTKQERLLRQQERFEQMLSYERALYASGCNIVAGVDEVGRGPLAGPVVTAAVILPRDFSLLGVDDSKKLTPKKRDELYDAISEAALCWSIGVVDNKRIDEINILEATKEAMIMAIDGLSQRPDHVLIDAVTLKSLELPQTAIVHGDALSVSIAAASIMAKVTRDRAMEDYGKLYPGYDFEGNKGYGTKAHYDGLDAHGPCPIHRRSFLVNYFERGNSWK